MMSTGCQSTGCSRKYRDHGEVFGDGGAVGVQNCGGQYCSVHFLSY